MEDFFSDPQPNTYSPPSHQQEFEEQQQQPQQTFFAQTQQTNLTFNYNPQFSYDNPDDDEFHPAEEDEVTKRIRQQEQTMQNKLRAKANQEYELKQKKKEQGSNQLQQFVRVKERQVQARKKQNCQTQERHVEQLKKENSEGGWAKVVSNIKTKQGEHPGKKDVSRMRQAILHRREDQK